VLFGKAVDRGAAKAAGLEQCQSFGFISEGRQTLAAEVLAVMIAGQPTIALA
jgi:hypothetical protein